MLYEFENYSQFSLLQTYYEYLYRLPNVRTYVSKCMMYMILPLFDMCQEKIDILTYCNITKYRNKSSQSTYLNVNRSYCKLFIVSL